jgi:hypothetical protein
MSWCGDIFNERKKGEGEEGVRTKRVSGAPKIKTTWPLAVLG